MAGHRTSVALEAEFWSALAQLATTRRLSLSALVAAADADRDPDRPLASALRVLALREFRMLSGQAGAAAVDSVGAGAAAGAGATAGIGATAGSGADGAAETVSSSTSDGG